MKLGTAAMTAVLAVALTGCKSAAPIVDDPTLAAKVQQRIAADSGLATEPIQVSVLSGAVTLTGNASSNAARSLAASDAASIAGVKQVVNNITVTPGVVSSTTATAPLPQIATVPSAPVRERIRTVQPAPAPAPIQRQAPPQQASAPPPPPAGPSFRNVTLPAGSTVAVRVTQTLDSENAQIGDAFSGSVATDIVQDGMLLIPRGTNVTGRVTQVHEAGHFSGASLLTVELTGIERRGERISVTSNPYTVEGKGRGKNTVTKGAIGAGAGAILGGIFGGGKGAAIGAAAGGGTGVGINAVTRGQQVQIPSESVVRFSINNSITVRTSTPAPTYGDPSLQQR